MCFDGPLPLSVCPKQNKQQKKKTSRMSTRRPLSRSSAHNVRRSADKLSVISPSLSQRGGRPYTGRPGSAKQPSALKSSVTSLRSSGKFGAGVSEPDSPPRTRGKENAASGEPGLEKEYLRNLQQQIYFLEVENNFLKEKGGMLVNKGALVEESEVPEGASLDNYVNKMKAKIIELKRRFEMEKQELEDQRDTAERAHLADKYLFEERERQVMQLRAEIDEMKDKMLQDRRQYDEEVIHLKNMLERCRTEADILSKEKVAMEGEMQKWRSASHDTETRIKKLEVHYRESQDSENRAREDSYASRRERKDADVSIFELQERLHHVKQENLHHVADLTKLQDEKLELQAKIRRLIGEVEEGKKAKRELEECADTLAETKRKLHRTKLSLAEAERTLAHNAENQKAITLERVVFRKMFHFLKSKLASSESNCQERSVSVDNMSSELVRAHQEVDVTRAEMRRRTEAEAEHRARYVQIDEENEKLTAENMALRHELEEEISSNQRLSQRLDSTTQALVEAKAERDQISQRLKASKAMDLLVQEIGGLDMLRAQQDQLTNRLGELAMSLKTAAARTRDDDEYED
eukprot:Rmarinus@m.93